MQKSSDDSLLRLKRDYQEFIRPFESAPRNQGKSFRGDDFKTTLNFSASIADESENCDFELPKSSHFEALTEEWKRPKSQDFSRLNKEVRHIQDITKIASLEQRLLSLENELKEKAVVMENAKKQSVEDKLAMETRIANLELNLQKSTYREAEAVRKWNETITKQSVEAKTAAWKVQKATDSSSADNSQLVEYRTTAEKQIRELRSELLSARSQLSSYVSEYQTSQAQVRCLTETNKQFSEDIQEWIEKHSTMEQNYLNAQRAFDQFKDEFKMAQTMLDEMKELKSLRVETLTLRQNCQKYRNLSENTWLLKEENSKLKEELTHMQKTHQNSLIELAELKSLLTRQSVHDDSSSEMDISDSHISSPSKADFSYSAVDKLSRKNAVLVASEKSLLSQLNEAKRQITSLTEELKQRLHDEEQKHQEELQDLADGLQSHFTNEVNILSQSLEAKQSELESLQSELGRVRDDLTTAESALDQALANYHQAQARVEVLEHPNVVDVSVNTDDSQTVVDESVVDSVRLQDEKITSLQSLIADLKRQLAEKEDYNPDTTQILHMAVNPLSEAHETYVNDCNQLQMENQRLKLRLEETEKLRENAGTSDVAMADAGVSGMVQSRIKEIELTKEVEELKAKVKVQEEKSSKMLQIHSDVTQQFREISSQLTGYQIRMKENTNTYRVQSLYDTEADRHFLFKKATSGTIDLLENDYVKTYADFVETYLGSDHSIPAFLSAVTLQLYNKNSTFSSTSETSHLS